MDHGGIGGTGRRGRALEKIVEVPHASNPHNMTLLLVILWTPH